MTLAMSQLERIRVKYRPSGFLCHVRLVRDAIGLFSKVCKHRGRLMIDAVEKVFWGVTSEIF